jgi:hypothetical protein
VKTYEDDPLLHLLEKLSGDTGSEFGNSSYIESRIGSSVAFILPLLFRTYLVQTIFGEMDPQL